MAENITNMDDKKKKLLEMAKKYNMLDYPDIMHLLKDMKPDSAQVYAVIEFLELNNVNILGLPYLFLDVDEPSDESLQRINVEEIEIDLSVPDIVEIDDPIRMYVKEVGEVALINAEEEIELAKRIEAGDDEARKQLVEASSGLVVTNAKNYVGRGMTFTDLILEGNKGLIKAVEKFDYRKGYKFRVYATWWIRYYIKRELSGIIH